MRARGLVAEFDSSTAMLRALSRYLQGRGFPALGLFRFSPRPLTLLNRLPRPAREFVYSWGGYGEAVSPRRARTYDAEAASRWVLSHYPRPRYRAAAIGAANGALTHLWAALGIPWLPQTLLVPVRRHGVHPDDLGADLEKARPWAEALLEANPELQLHQMHDPNQDRLMVRHMSYFRLKRRRLGRELTRFLEERLEPGATLFVADCRLSWPTRRVSERYVFQAGGLGGLTPEEYLRGGPRVAEVLRRYGSPRERWTPPGADGLSPEAEWGFEPALIADIEELARRRGYQVRRVSFDDPEDPSPMTAELYRWWYRRRGLPARRLIVESFILMDPWWTLRLAAAPFWMVFNTERSARALENYLDRAEPFDDIRMMLFSHGVDSAGLVDIPHWKRLLGRARRTCGFSGVDERAYPRDFGAFVRYHTSLKRLAPRQPIPPPLTLEELDSFLAESAARFPVDWSGGGVAA